MNRVSDDDRSTLFSFLARGASQGYAPQSGEIVGILKQLMAAQKEEEDRKANQAGPIAAKEEEIATLTATIETKLTQQGNLAAEVESRKNDVADTQRSLAADQELAAKLAESCSGQSSEWEVRQKSRGKRGSLCARRRSRKTVTCHCLCVVEPVYIRPCWAADGGTRGELRGRASLVAVDVFDRTHLLDLFLSLCADGARQVRLACAKPQTSREVDQDPEGGLTRQCNTRPSFLITCCVWETPSQVDAGGLLHRAAQAQHRQAL